MISFFTFTSIRLNGRSDDGLSFGARSASPGRARKTSSTAANCARVPARKKLMPSGASRIVPFRPCRAQASRRTSRRASKSSSGVNL